MNTSSHNYNVDFDPRLFGREASGKGKSSAAPADATATRKQTAQQQPAKQKTKDAPEYRITEVAITVPSDGLKKDQPFDIAGKVQPLVGTLTKKKIRLELITRYKDVEDRIGTVEADIDTNANTFGATCKQLFYHDGWMKDAEKPASAKFTLEAKAAGSGAEKELVSKPVELPMQTTTVELKNGKYDDVWVKAHEATHPKSGKECVPDNKVKKLQENLIQFRFLPQKADDGMFGDQTEAAVKQFQESAGKPERKKADDIKIVKADKITFDGTVDGIVGEKTEKEIAVWLQNNWVKPDSEYRKGDYDDNGVKNKFGERGGDKHHPGTGITELQKDLAAVKAYNGKIDGIYGEKTEAAVTLFQEKATAGDLLDEQGKKAAIKDEEKLKGHRQKVGDGPTVATAKDSAKKKLVIGEGSDDCLIFYAPGKNEYFEVEPADIDTLMTEIKVLDDLHGKIAEFRASSGSSGSSGELAKKGEELKNEVESTLEGITKSPGDAIQELLVVKTNPRWGKMKSRVYIRGYQTKKGAVKGHWRKHSDATIKKKLDEWLKKEPEKKQELEAKLKATIVDFGTIDTKWPWEWKVSAKAAGEAHTPIGYFSGSAEAQFLRFVAGASVGAEFDLKEKKLDVSGKGSISYALAEGKVTGTWALPDKDGFNAFDCLELTDNARKAIKPNRECRFRVGIEAQGKAFVGASLSAAVMLPSIDLGTANKKKAAAGASGSAFAGASAEGSLGAKMEWSPDKATKFDSLAEITGTLAGSAGIGAEGKFSIEYQNGKVRFEAGVMATLGLGGKGGTAFEIGVDEAIELFAHLFYCVDWHRIDSVTLLAFQFYLNATFAQFVIAKKASDYAFDKFNDFRKWLSEEKKNPRSLAETKKQINATVNDIKKLNNSPPETLGRLLQTIMSTAEEDDFDAILKILKSADSEHRLKWILRNVVENPGKTDAEKGKALEEGVRRVMEFGAGIPDIEMPQKAYVKKVDALFKQNGIRYG